MCAQELVHDCPSLADLETNITHLHSPSLTCTHLHSPSLTFTHLHSPALTCTHLHSPTLTCTHLHSPALTCTLSHHPSCLAMVLTLCWCSLLQAMGVRLLPQKRSGERCLSYIYEILARWQLHRTRDRQHWDFPTEWKSLSQYSRMGVANG